MYAFGKEYHLWMLADSVSQSVSVLNQFLNAASEVAFEKNT